jgi:hypothetical protein
MLSADINTWCGVNSDEVDWQVSNLAPYLFELMKSLAVVVNNIPETWPNLGVSGMQLGGKQTTCINFTQSPKDHMLLRSAISLTGDAHCVTKCLRTMKIGSLKQPIDNLHAELDKLRDFRNFLTHLDARFSDRAVHGISGATKTGCGIEYTETASDCFHLMLVGNTVHYSDRKLAKEAHVGKEVFQKILAETEKVAEVFNEPIDMAKILARFHNPPQP